MQRLDPGNIVENLSWRAAIKKFDPARRIPADTWNSLEKSLVLAPSSCGLQPWKFLVITDPKVRAQLRPHAHNQGQITDASHLVVICRRSTMTEADVERLIKRIIEVRNVPASALTDYRGMMLGLISGLSQKDRLSEWTARQVYISLGVFLASCAMAGIDACPMEGFDAAEFDQVLGLPATGYNATVLAAVGYRASDDPYAGMAKVRFPVEAVIQRIN